MAVAVFFVQEREQMQRYNQRLIEELKNKQTQEKARLPKIQRSDAKTRMAMFKKSLHIAGTVISPEQEREKAKQVNKIWNIMCCRSRTTFLEQLDANFVSFFPVCSAGGEEAEE